MNKMKDRFVSLLRSSERYTNLDMVYFASGSFWQTFGQACNSALALVLVIVFANFLPKETYGTYRYLISLASVLNVLTLTGMSQAVAQAVANGRDGALRTSVRYQLKWNLLLMLASWVVGAYYIWNANFSYGIALFVLSLSTPFSAALNTYGPYLGAKRQFRLNNIFGVLSTFIYVLGMLVAIFVSGEVIWLIIAYAVTTAGANILFYALTLHMFHPPIEPADDVLKYGRHLTYIELMTPVVAQLDSILLTHFWGPAQLAIYSIAMAIPNRVVPFIKNLVNVGFPKIVTKTVDELDRRLYQRLAQGILIGIACAGAYALVAPYLFKYLLSQYLDAVFYTQLLAASFVFAMPTRYVSILLTAKRQSKAIFITNLINNILLLVLYIALGTLGGILGLITAKLIVSFLGFLTNLSAWLLVRKRIADY